MLKNQPEFFHTTKKVNEFISLLLRTFDESAVNVENKMVLVDTEDNVNYKFPFNIIEEHYDDLIKNLDADIGFKDAYFLCDVYGGYNPIVEICGKIINNDFVLTHVVIS